MVIRWACEKVLLMAAEKALQREVTRERPWVSQMVIQWACEKVLLMAAEKALQREVTRERPWASQMASKLAAVLDSLWDMLLDCRE
jgi:hypothetical protein